MIQSIGWILALGLLFGWGCKKIKLPPLLGMLFAGILLGPYGLGILDDSILSISAEIRKMALIIILARAGLGLDLSGLKKLGRPAFLMCFLPATMEVAGILLLGPKLLGLSFLEAALLGAVLAAVSPAVVVPRMVKLTEEGYGIKQGIPQLILAGASVDDVYVIVLFSTFTDMMKGNTVSYISFVNIPISILLGMGIGFLGGWLLAKYYEAGKPGTIVKGLVFLIVAFFMVAGEDHLQTPITFSALIGVMFLGIGLQKYSNGTAKQLAAQFGKLWIPGEVFLFVLVGATVNITYLGKVGPAAVLLIAGGLLFRMFGVLLCLIKTPLKWKERIFTMLAYCPKATVQAAIGGVPLALGFGCGEVVLTAAVLAIVITAPLGAWAIDNSYTKMLKRN